MSRSKRRTPIFGNTKAESEKADKQLAHRRARRCLKQILDDEEALEEFPPDNRHTNSYDMDKDGKHYWHDADEEDMRK
jgi:hypothetical protein